MKVNTHTHTYHAIAQRRGGESLRVLPQQVAPEETPV